MTLTGFNRVSGHEGLFFVDRRERENRVSWSELRTKSQAVARSLMELGVQPGQREALVYRTEEEFFYAFSAASVLERYRPLCTLQCA